MSKDLYVAAHEEVVEEYLDAHPDADWTEAYERTADAAYGRYVDKYASLIDQAKERRKYGA